jgi:transcriptional regulator with XRE-family HTH domain
MSELYVHIGLKIRELRRNYGGQGIRQDKLAEALDTTANTISRWETAAYKPTANDLHSLARFFGTSISVFFPGSEDTRLDALMSATGNLSDDDIEDVTEYVQFRKARRRLKESKKRNK